MTPGERTSVVVVVTEVQNTANQIESQLRNAGHAVRAAWVTDLEDVEDAIKRASPDLVFCAEGMTYAPQAEVTSLCATLAPDLPVILLGGEVDLASACHALEMGARDAACATDPDYLRHLELVTIREIGNHTQLRQLRDVRMKLAQFESRHRELLAGTADALAQIQEGIVTSCNRALAELLEYASDEELNGQLFMELVAPDSLQTVKEGFRKLQKAKVDSVALDITLKTKAGEYKEASIELSRDAEHGSPEIQLLVRADEKDQAEATAAPPSAAAPSGRSALLAALNHAAEHSTSGALSLIFVAIDGYENLEQRLGCFDADELVDTASTLLESRCEKGDQVFRFSVSELVLLVARADEDRIEKFADAMRKELASQVFKTAEFESHVTATVVAYPLGEESPAPTELINDLVAEARRRSGGGGNEMVILGPTAKAAQEERDSKRQVTDIRKAVEQDRLKLAFQSIASLEGESRQIFDVFVRMVDTAGMEVMARDFLPAAEQGGLMRLIDRWVVSRIIRQIAKSKDADNCFFVRISEDTLRDGAGFIGWLTQTIKQAGISPSRLVFQIQETLVEKHIRKAKDFTKSLKELGAGLAIDYFGTSPTSEKLVDHIGMQYLKFHYSFTENFKDAAASARLRELMEVAKQHKVRTIVAQVEDANAMATLWQLGINYIQGNSVQEPEVVMMQADVTLT